jgi:hypothetical protein
MLTSIRGVYRNGQVELAEAPREVSDETPVIVTFVPTGVVDLRERGINEEQAEELRARLAPFGEDWNEPGMSIYDDYDAAKSPL